MVQWLAIGLSFIAVAIILRYARQPRCDVCSRRHTRPDLATPGSEVGFVGAELSESSPWAKISWKADY